MLRPRHLALLGVLAVSASCSAMASSPSTSPGHAPSPTAASAAPATGTPSATSASPGEGRHADAELEALLPTALGGVALVVESQSGSDLATDSAAFDAFLTGLGRTRADFSLASAYSRGGLKAQVGAWRVRGADPDRLLPGFIVAVQSSSATPLTRVDEVVAGRAVTRIGDPGQLTQGPIWVVVRGDTLLFVQTTDPTLADEAIAKLPG